MHLPTPATIAQLATATGHAVNLVTAIGKKIKNGKKITVDEILEIQTTLMDMQGKQQNIISDNADLEAKIKELEQALKFTGELHFDGEVYWIGKEPQRDGPFCHLCHDKHGKMVRLTSGKDYNAKWRCVVCFGVYSRNETPTPTKRSVDLSTD